MAKATRIEGLQEALAVMDGEVARKASVRSVNDITKQGRTAARKKIREAYNVKLKPLNDRMRVQTVSQSGGGTAKITTTGRRLALDHFTGTRVSRSGVSAQIKKSGPRSVFRWGFRARMPSGGELIVERAWRARHVSMQPGRKVGGFAPKPYRLPVQRIETLGPAAMFDQDRVYAEVQKLVDEKYDDIYRRNYEFYAARV